MRKTQILKQKKEGSENFIFNLYERLALFKSIFGGFWVWVLGLIHKYFGVLGMKPIPNYVGA